MKSILLISAIIISSFNQPGQKKTEWMGAVSNGYKGDAISFTISADGKRLENLTFTGYWRCSGKIEQTSMGPEKSYPVQNGRVSAVITEPENGGATAFRFDLNAVIAAKTASGTLRISLNALSCDTYQLKWTAQRK